MAVISISIDKLKQTLKLDEKQIISTLEKLGFPAGKEGEGRIWVETTPDRPDMLSGSGVIRALKHYCTTEQVKKDTYKAKESDWIIQVDENITSRPYIAACLIKGVCLDEDRIEGLMQFQEKIHETLGRKRKKVAIGVHDADNIFGKKLVYRRGRDESFVPLNETEEMKLREVLEKTEKGKDYANLCKEECVIICDEKGIISFPPILNSERTKITEKTKNILVEATGTHEETVNYVVNLLACDFIDEGGQVEKINIKYREREEWTPTMEWKSMRCGIEKINKLIGKQIEEDIIISSLNKMGLVVERKEKKELEVFIPPYRIDFMDETDVIEDILIGYGYDKIEKKELQFYQVGKVGKEYNIISKIRETLVRMGYNEIKSTFLKGEFPKPIFGKERTTIKILNPCTKEVAEIRQDCLNSLLKSIEENKMKKLPIKLFEVEHVAYIKENQINERVQIGLAIMDDISKINEMWEDVILLYNICFNDNAKFEKKTFNNFIRSGEVKGKTSKISGIIGEIDPEILNKYNINKPIVVCILEI